MRATIGCDFEDCRCLGWIFCAGLPRTEAEAEAKEVKKGQASKAADEEREEEEGAGDKWRAEGRGGGGEAKGNEKSENGAQESVYACICYCSLLKRFAKVSSAKQFPGDKFDEYI